MFSIKNNNLKSLAAGITTRAASGQVGQYPTRKTGQPIPGTKVKPSDPILKAVEAAKPQKASAHPKPFVVSKALAASKTLNVAPSPGNPKPVAACKPLNIVKRSSAPKATKASGLLKTPAVSKVLDIAAAAGTPKLPPGLQAPGSPKTYAAAVAACKPLNIVKRSSPPKAPQVPSLFKTRPASKVIDTDFKISPSLQAAEASKTAIPRASAIEAVRRQINEQKQKAAAVTARKAKAKSEPLPPAKPKAATPTCDATLPSASVSRPEAEQLITATANAAENAPLRSPARRPLPAVRKGGVRKSLAAVSRPPSTAFSPSPSPVRTGDGCSRHQRNSLCAAARLSEHAFTRRNGGSTRDSLFKLGAPAHGPVVSRSISAPLLGWAKAAATVTRSKSGPIAVSKVFQLTHADTDTNPKVLRAVKQDMYSGGEGAADANATAKAGEADTSTISTLVGSDEDASVCVTVKIGDADSSASTLAGSDEDVSDHKLSSTSSPFQIEIQDFDVQSDTFPAPRARDSMSSLATLSFTSILDMFPAVPASIPGPLTQDVHRQLMEMSSAFTADNRSAEDGRMSNTSSASSISSILDQFPVVPTYIPRPLPQAAHRQLASTDSSFAAADGGCADGGSVSSPSSTSSISSILRQFPMVPTYIPRPLPQTAHVQPAPTSPALVADQATKDIVPARDSLPSLSSILDEFPMAPTYIPHPLPQAAHAQLAGMRPASAADKPARANAPADTPAAHPAPADDDRVRMSIISLDGDAPVLDTPAVWKAAFDAASLDGSATAVASSVGPCEKKTPAAKAMRGVKGWWRRMVGRK